jgi:Flp pilus assembly protein TadD
MELDPKYAWPWNGLGNLLQVHLGRYDEAEAAYRRAMELDPKNGRPWNGLGNLLQVHLGRYDEAEAAYRRAMELDPKYAWPWNGLGNLLQVHLGRYDEAEAAYRRAMELDPKYASPWIGLGTLLQDHLGRYDEAEAAFRRAMELDPADPFPVVNLARLLARQDQGEPASEAYRQVIALVGERKEPADHGQLLQAHLWLRNQDAALQALDALAQAASNDDVQAMFRLREQARECSAIGLAGRLGALMESSVLADFLRPFSLALKAVSGDPEALIGIPPELKTVAEEVLAALPEQQGLSRR